MVLSFHVSPTLHLARFFRPFAHNDAARLVTWMKGLSTTSREETQPRFIAMMIADRGLRERIKQRIADLLHADCKLSQLEYQPQEVGIFPVAADAAGHQRDGRDEAHTRPRDEHGRSDYQLMLPSPSAAPLGHLHALVQPSSDLARQEVLRAQTVTVRGSTLIEYLDADQPVQHAVKLHVCPQGA